MLTKVLKDTFYLLSRDAWQTFEEKFNVKEHTNTSHEFLVFIKDVAETFEIDQDKVNPIRLFSELSMP